MSTSSPALTTDNLAKIAKVGVKIVLSAPSLRLPTPTPSQARVLSEARRFNVLACGRRWGKSTMAAYQMALAASQGQRVGYFAPAYKYLLEVYRDTVHILGGYLSRRNDNEKRLETVRGGVIEFWTLEDKNAGISRKYHYVDIDEAAKVPDLEYAWNANISPTLADYQGVAWFRSSPKGRNYFWQLYQRGLDPTNPDWMSWQMPTATNPYIAAEELERQRRDLPELIYRQEFLAEFIDDGAGVFRRVLEASTSEPQVDAQGQPAPTHNHQYVIGVDWGKLNDFTAISVWDVTERREVYLDRFNQIDYAFQAQRLKRLVDAFKPTVLIVEENSIGQPMLEQLTRLGMNPRGFYTSNESKAQIIEALALSLEQARVQLLNDPVATGEMLAFSASRTPSGRMVYSAPAGQHDDTVMARALAHYAGLVHRGLDPDEQYRYAAI